MFHQGTAQGTATGYLPILLFRKFLLRQAVAWKAQFREANSGELVLESSIPEIRRPAACTIARSGHTSGL